MPNQSPGELYPPNMEYALIVLRFANAEARTKGESTFRFQLYANIHEPLDPESDLAVWDEVDEAWLTVSDVVCRVSAEHLYWINYQYRNILKRMAREGHTS